MSMHKIRRGLNGNRRAGTQISIKVDGDEKASVTLQEGKYLQVEALEYLLVTQGKKVEVDVDDWHREYTVPAGRVMVVRWTYEDFEE